MLFMLYTYLLLPLRNNFLKFHPCGHKIRPDMQNITKLITSERSRRLKLVQYIMMICFLSFVVNLITK